MKFKEILLPLLAFFIYSQTAIFIKLASREAFLSFNYCLYFGIALLIVAIYAVLWQYILKKTSLNKAFMFKSSTIIFGLFISYFLFQETITLNNIAGSLFIITGIILSTLKL